MSINSVELQIVFYRNVLHQDIQMIACKTGLSEQKIGNILRRIRTRSMKKILPPYYYLTYNTGVRKKVYRWSSKYELCRNMFNEEIEKFLHSLNE